MGISLATKRRELLLFSVPNRISDEIQTANLSHIEDSVSNNSHRDNNSTLTLVSSRLFSSVIWSCFVNTRVELKYPGGVGSPHPFSGFSPQRARASMSTFDLPFRSTLSVREMIGSHTHHFGVEDARGSCCCKVAPIGTAVVTRTETRLYVYDDDQF